MRKPVLLIEDIPPSKGGVVFIVASALEDVSIVSELFNDIDEEISTTPIKIISIEVYREKVQSVTKAYNAYLALEVPAGIILKVNQKLYSH